MSFSRILYMTCVNGVYLVSEIFNNIDRKTWREIKETLQWPPMENQLVVCTRICFGRSSFNLCAKYSFKPWDVHGRMPPVRQGNEQDVRERNRFRTRGFIWGKLWICGRK